MTTKAVALLLAALACAAPAAAQSSKPAFGTWGVDLTSMDRSVKPGDDFFLYVNGTWLKSAVIPADRTSTGAFQDLEILSENRMKSLVGELEGKSRDQLDAEGKQLRDLYDAFEDTAAIEAAGLKPAQTDLNYFASLKTPEDVAVAMGSRTHATDSIFGDGIAPDSKNSNAYVVTFRQSGLGMPDRDYYVRDDKALAATRDSYKQYLATMLTLSGAKDADARAKAVFDLETALAKPQ